MVQLHSVGLLSFLLIVLWAAKKLDVSVMPAIVLRHLGHTKGSAHHCKQRLQKCVRECE
jgi:hypothetical protein